MSSFAAGEPIRRWEPFRRQAEKRLRILEASTGLGDLAALNSNRLEALKGNRKGQYSIRINDQCRISSLASNVTALLKYSIRINDQCRICFEWPKEAPGPIDVAIVDYH